MTLEGTRPAFEGDSPAAAEWGVLPDRRELALVAVERTRMPMVITDPRQPDNPIVLANQAFLDLTGYAATEVIGSNCRFLQGPATDVADIEFLRRALAAGEGHIDCELLNYRKDGSTFWNQLTISAVHDDEGKLLYYFASQKDVTRRREMQKLEASERLLLMEVDHRAMNALALVQSIVKLSRADSIERFSRSIAGRVDALARAHRLLANSSWSSADLGELVAMEVGQSEVEISGPGIRLPPRLVQPLCLVLHELVTNAREHGGLASADRRTSVTWETTEKDLIVGWTEAGVPIDVLNPPQRGLGLGLVQGIIQQQLGGRLRLEWLASGLSATFEIPWQR